MRPLHRRYLIYDRFVFTARVITGSGRGKGLGTPTLNLDLRDVPTEMQKGIYACWVKLPSASEKLPVGSATKNILATPSLATGNYAAALHFGPRPVFKDTVTCEVHLLDTTLPSPPASVTVTLVERLRDVRDFPSPEVLKEEIARDIERCRVVLQG